MMSTTTDRINLLWDWCCDAYLRIGGRQLRFPKDTDRTKTYQWRYLTTLNNKLIEWEFDDDLAKSYIETAIHYANERRLLNKGLSIFMQHNLLQECYERLRKNTNYNTDIIDIIRRTYWWLQERLQEQQTNLIDLLLQRQRLGGYTNIVNWYQGGYLPLSYLVVSRACGAAIARLARNDPNERSVLPADMQLFLAHAKIANKVAIISELRNLLRDDWRRPVC